MIAIIAEKPSVGQDIARVIGANEKHTGYLQGNDYIVTWALGHLLQLAPPENYGFKRGGGELPVIPESFQLIVRQKKKDRKYVTDAAASRQLNIIDKVLEQCDSIIAATDAGREGELIFRWIYAHTASDLPFKRLWISSLTDEAIEKGMANLADGAAYDNLSHAVQCRAKADWLTGINASNALSQVTGVYNHSLGRVQTPTLAMICSRYLENRHFHPLDYWHIYATLTKGDAFRKFRLAEDIRTDLRAEELFGRIKDCDEALITKVESKNEQEPGPLLYDLTALQKDCNIYFDMTAEQTLAIAQALYEKKLISYPRTGSRYITPDIVPQIPSLLRMILRMERFAHFAGSIDVLRIAQRSVDAGKVTDHHALILTGYFARGLSEDEDKVYHLIAGRMLEGFAPKCEKTVTLTEATIGGHLFRSRSTETVAEGWRGVYNRPEDTEKEDADTQTVGIGFTEGETATVGGLSKVQKKTKPRPLFTDATLLAAMETAGKDIEDEATRAAMRDCGIGTPATRAAIITTLFEREYIERSGKSLIPTEKGLYIYRAVKDMRIADAELTGSWEKTLSMIESGQMRPATFMTSIETFTKQVTNEILSLEIPKEEANLPLCPKCKTGGVVVRHKVCKCNNPECGFTMFRKFLNMEISDQNVSQLLSKGKTGLIKGFQGKRSNTFDARLMFDKAFNLVFLFPDKDGKKKKTALPKGKPKPGAKSGAKAKESGAGGKPAKNSP